MAESSGHGGTTRNTQGETCLKEQSRREGTRSRFPLQINLYSISTEHAANGRPNLKHEEKGTDDLQPPEKEKNRDQRNMKCDEQKAKAPDPMTSGTESNVEEKTGQKRERH